MRTIFPILISVLLSACSPNPKVKILTDKKIQSSLDSSLTVGDYQFVSTKVDSSYADYWCSIKILSKTFEKIEELDLLLVTDFLATFNSKCNNNVEFSQWSNELLFDVCLRKPELVLRLISQNSSLDREEIVKQFESPIHDGIDLDVILKGVEDISPSNLKDSELWRTKMIQGIEKSIEKSV